MASQSSGSSMSHGPLDPKSYEVIIAARNCYETMRGTRHTVMQFIKVMTNEQVVAPRQCHTAISAVTEMKEPVQALHALLSAMPSLSASIVPTRLALIIDLQGLTFLLEDARQILTTFQTQLVQSPQEERRLRQPLMQKLDYLQKSLQVLYHTLRLACEKFLDLSEEQVISKPMSFFSSEEEQTDSEEPLTQEAILFPQLSTIGGNEMIKTDLFTHGYALVIGVGKDLPVTVKDATAVKDVLVDAQRCAYPLNQVRLLTEQQATQAMIMQGLEWLIQKSQEDTQSTIIVYFSGHGGDFPDYYLVPRDYDPRQLDSTTISGKVLTEKLAAIHAKKLFIVLDCCHAGGMTAVKAPAFRASPMPPELAVVLAEGSGRVVIASSRKDEVSLTGDPYSEFTLAFLEALAGYGAAEQDGYAYITDIALYVGRMVANRTKDRQHPLLNIQGADNFAVAYYAGGEKSPRPLASQPISLFPFEIQDDELTDGYRRIYKQFQRNLLTIEEQMARFIDQAAVPPDLIRAKADAITKLAEIEQEIKKQR